MNPRNVVIMGVSGSGKSTVGEHLAARSGGEYFDGDDFHPPENVEKMRQGIPLTDEDRVGWFEALCELIRSRRLAGQWTFIACSSLKRRFRDVMRSADPHLQFIHLEGSFDLIRGRMESRKGHYMPASLLESQFAALEEPQEDESDIQRLSIEGPAESISEEAARLLGL